VVGSHFTATGVSPEQLVKIWLLQTMSCPQSALVTQGAAWQLMDAGPASIMVAQGRSISPSKQIPTGVVAVASIWQLKPFAQSASLVQVLAWPRPGRQSALAMTASPRISLREVMAISFADGLRLLAT